MAHVLWMEDHPYQSMYSSIICCTTMYAPQSSMSFIPVARISGHCAVAEESVVFDYGEDKVTFCVPLLKQILV